MDEILFESKGGFQKIRLHKNGRYCYAERKGIDSVAFILIDKNRDDKYGVTNERKPPMDARYNKDVFLETAFGGSNDMIDMDKYLAMSDDEIIKHFKELVKIEAKEEAGYNVPIKNIKFISKEFVSTQMNQWCYLFLVDVTDIKMTGTDPQSAMEALATTKWKTLKQIQNLNDWKTKTIIFNTF